jgi:tetratricopeptide (TPR) repeat protein
MDFSWITDLSWTDIIAALKQAWPILAGSGVLVGLWTWLRRQRAKRKLPPSDGAQFTLLVAELDGDADHTQTRHILAEPEKQFPPRGEARLHVLPYPETLKPGPGERTAALLAAEERGRRWLKDKNADVLIWGEVGAKDKVLRLRFTAPAGNGGGQKPYEMNSALELPPNFGADLGAVFAAQAATSISPVYDRSGEALAALLLPIVAKLKPLAGNPPASFADETRATLWQAYADGEQRLGEELGDNARLATAIAFFKKVLTLRPRDKAPLDWAKAQNDLGLGLWRLGERESGTARLEAAVAAYREALKERTREGVPLGWAMTQNNLGNALYSLGERESGTARLEEAVAAYREALKEHTRERVPLGWATTQNNLGNALQTLGARESGTARLEEAVAAYREALKERTRERVPLDWAMTQNNFGGALQTLGEREAESDKTKGREMLKTAREHCAAALEEFKRAGASYYVEGTQENIERIDGAIAGLGEEKVPG